MEKITVSTSKRDDFVDITDKISSVIRRMSLEDGGICVICVPHTTCGLTINENADPSVPSDIMNKLKRLIPQNDGYSHMEGNSDAHIKSTLTGHSLTLILEKGVLQLGTWQGIFLCEFDGPRIRQVWITVLKR